MVQLPDSRDSQKFEIAILLQLYLNDSRVNNVTFRFSSGLWCEIDIRLICRVSKYSMRVGGLFLVLEAPQ